MDRIERLELSDSEGDSDSCSDALWVPLTEADLDAEKVEDELFVATNESESVRGSDFEKVPLGELLNDSDALSEEERLLEKLSVGVSVCVAVGDNEGESETDSDTISETEALIEVDCVAETLSDVVTETDADSDREALVDIDKDEVILLDDDTLSDAEDVTLIENVSDSLSSIGAPHCNADGSDTVAIVLASGGRAH